MRHSPSGSECPLLRLTEHAGSLIPAPAPSSFQCSCELILHGFRVQNGVLGVQRALVCSAFFEGHFLRVLVKQDNHHTSNKI